MPNYKEKIQKLLALAESSNENEAKAALLKARKLMAEHKLLESDCLPENSKVRKELVGIKYTNRKTPWMVLLASLIAENHCCISFRSHKKYKQISEIGFVGLNEDFEICTTIFKYAVDCIQSYQKELQAQYEGTHSADFILTVCKSYGYGFVNGLASAYRKQSEENKQEWGLVLSIPREVHLECLEMHNFKISASPQTPTSREEIEAHLKGQEDGENFDPKKRLANDIQG